MSDTLSNNACVSSNFFCNSAEVSLVDKLQISVITSSVTEELRRLFFILESTSAQPPGCFRIEPNLIQWYFGLRGFL